MTKAFREPPVGISARSGPPRGRLPGYTPRVSAGLAAYERVLNRAGLSPVAGHRRGRPRRLRGPARGRGRRARPGRPDLGTRPGRLQGARSRQPAKRSTGTWSAARSPGTSWSSRPATSTGSACTCATSPGCAGPWPACAASRGSCSPTGSRCAASASRRWPCGRATRWRPAWPRPRSWPR